jgi:chromosome segregation ATPase
MDMFNLFPKKKSVDEIIEDANLTPPWQWNPTQTPSMLQAQNELIEQFLKENHDLKKEIQELKKDVHQPELCNEKIFKLREENVELKKILIDLKKENVELMDRVNEIDNDVIRDLNDEILVLKNDIALWKAKHQIIYNDYEKCAEQRDEFKHQLNAANKEIELLKKEKKDSFEILKKTIENESARFHELVAKHTDKWIKLDAANKEIEALKSKIKDNEQNHSMYPLHWGILQEAKDLTEGVEVNLNKPLDEQCDDFFDKTYEPCERKKNAEVTWEEAASDLALRVVKLERKVEELTLINIQNPYSALNPDGTFKNAIPCYINTSSHDLTIKGII